MTLFHSLPEVTSYKKNYVTFCILGILSCFCCRLLMFFKIIFFQKLLSGTLSDCQTVWIQFRNDILSGLIWVQTVCKDYQQMRKYAPWQERANVLVRHRSIIWGLVTTKPVFGISDTSRLKPVSSATGTS